MVIIALDKREPFLPGWWHLVSYERAGAAQKGRAKLRMAEQAFRFQGPAPAPCALSRSIGLKAKVVDMIHLKLETEIQGLRCSFTAWPLRQPTGEGDEPAQESKELKFSYKSPTPVVVTFRPREQHNGDRPVRSANAVCTAIASLDIEPEVKLEIGRAIENERINIRKIKEDTVKLIDNYFIHLRAVSRSTVNIFNWMHGLDGPPDPFMWRTGQSLYSEDGEHWFQYYLGRKVTLLVEEATHSIYASNAQIEEVVRRVEAGAEEPLARQVFREAWEQIGVNPRSALVIGVSAAEVALRGLIGTLIPEAKWLVEEIQTPPVGKTLRKFLPTLPVRARRLDGRSITPPSKLVKLIEKAFELRNDVVHVGAPPPSRQELAIMLRAISDLLWICDIYLGELWAEKHVLMETKRNWQPKTS